MTRDHPGSPAAAPDRPARLADRASCCSSRNASEGIGALIAYDAWVLLGSAVVAGLAYVLGGRRLVPSGLVACALAPVTGLALRGPAVEVAVLAALAVVILAAHRENIRRAFGRAATAS